MKKFIMRSLILILILMIFPVCPVQAAPKYTGTYSKTFKSKEKMDSYPAYIVTINRVKNKKNQVSDYISWKKRLPYL